MILRVLQQRFLAVLNDITDSPYEYLDMIRPSQDPKFGDFQANMAMPLGKPLGKPPRKIAEEIISKLEIDDLCHLPEIAGPGFINLRIREERLREFLALASKDDRLGVEKVNSPKTYIVDYSSPNVAKPMHVGHIRSTVIGNAIAKMLRFIGHNVVTDNHIGDWGTQFGMIIYGYRNFLDRENYEKNPVAELARLYRLVRKLVDYHVTFSSMKDVRLQLAIAQERWEWARETYENSDMTPDDKKKGEKETRRLLDQLHSVRETVLAAEEKITLVQDDPELLRLAVEHENIAQAVLEETAKLHASDPENLKLWCEFLPACMSDIQRIYDRLKVEFDHTLGESYYNDRLGKLVDWLLLKGFAQETDGAVGVFLDGFDVPMLIRKKDGAFLYATTDLATVQFRMEQFDPDAILYLTDFRQSLHFEQLFASVKLFGYENLELTHVKFGTVLGEDGKPFKTRSGDTVGLESLLDEAEKRAYEIISNNDDSKPRGSELSEEQRRETARRIGIGAIIYADLSQNRESDYVFSYDKMLAMNGNTATYMQYAYARVCSIFAKGEIDPLALRNSAGPDAIVLDRPEERALALEILKFGEAVEIALRDYRPNQLTNYLFELSNRYSAFFEKCPVLKAEEEATRTSRLLLCDLTARTIGKGLELLGIETVERM